MTRSSWMKAPLPTSRKIACCWIRGPTYSFRRSIKCFLAPNLPASDGALLRNSLRSPVHEFLVGFSDPLVVIDFIFRHERSRLLGLRHSHSTRRNLRGCADHGRPQ